MVAAATWIATAMAMVAAAAMTTTTAVAEGDGPPSVGQVSGGQKATEMGIKQKWDYSGYDHR